MKNFKTLKKNALRQIAAFMCIGAKTAPKAKGIDNIVTLIIDTEKDRLKLIKRMLKISKRENKPGFARDADTLKKTSVLIIIGTKTRPIGLVFCSFCGYADCEHLLKTKSYCAFNALDLGIATGSAVSIAADFHIDNRIMYSVGKTAIELNLFKDKDIKIALGIPLSATGKNPFFDRK